MDREQTARRRYECGWGCGEPIEPGTRYVYASIPPQSSVAAGYSEHWQHARLHGRSFYDCPSVSIHPRGSDKPAEQSRVTVVTPTTGEAER